MLNHSGTRTGHVAWTPPSLPKSIVLMSAYGSAPELTAEILPGKKQRQASIYFPPGGETFSLKHSGYRACGITDGQSIVLIGGSRHNYVTRWVGAKS